MQVYNQEHDKTSPAAGFPEGTGMLGFDENPSSLDKASSLLRPNQRVMRLSPADAGESAEKSNEQKSNSFKISPKGGNS